MTRPMPEHGTTARYRRGCRCTGCTRAAVREDAKRQLDRLAGRPRLVPTKVVVAHVTALRDRGLRDIDIVRAAGLDGHFLNTLLKQRQINRITANKLLSVPLDHKPTPHQVKAVGTVRRIQALYSLGYSGADIGRRIGLTPAAVWRLAHDRNAEVKATTDAAMRVAYGQLRTQPGTSLKARNMAARNGWHGPLAWDNIDDPAEQPDTSTPANSLNAVELAAERGAEIQHLARLKTHPSEIGRQLGMTEASVRKHLSRKHHALYLELTA